MNRHDLDPADQRLGDELIEHFETEASAFSPAPLDGSALWAQGRDEGRRARRRTALQMVAASVAMLLVAGLAFWQVPQSVVPAKAPRGGALPSVVHLPDDPTRLETPPEDSLRTGRLSLVTGLRANRGTVMGVTAGSGTHLRLTLPDAVLSTESASTGPVMSLSRDGSRLAWAHRKRVAESAVEYSGVSVAHLETGEVSTFEVRGAAGENIAVSALAFSPDGSRIAWYGPSYTSDLGVSEETHVGRIDLAGSADGAPTFTAGSSRPGQNWNVHVAVQNDGTVAVLQGNRKLRRYPNSTAESLGDAVSAGTHSPGDDESYLAGLTARPGGTGLALGYFNFRKAAFTLADTSIPKFPGEVRPATTAPPRWTLPASTARTNEDGRLVGLSPSGAALVSSVSSPAHLYHLATEKDGTQSVSALVEFDGMQSSSTVLVALDLADTDPVDFRTPSWATWWAKLWHSGTGWIWLLLIAGLISIGFSLRIFIRSYRGLEKPKAPHGAGRPGRLRGWLRRIWNVVSFGCEMVMTAVLVWLLVITITPVLPFGTPQTAPKGAFPTRSTPYDIDDLSGYNGPVPIASRELSLTSTAGSAFSTPVGTDATTGAHVRPELDGWNARQQWTPLALDPSGRRIAYAWHSGEDAYGPTSSADDVGLAVHDVITGETTHEVLTTPAGHRIELTDVAWSPDGSSVAWEGRAPREDGKKKRRQLWVGVTPSDTLSSARWTYRDSGEQAIAATPDGTLLTIRGTQLRTFSPTNVDGPVRTDPIATRALTWHGAAVSPDGTELALGLGGENMDPFATGVRLIDLDDDAPTLRAHPWKTQGSSRVLGWSPQGSIIVASSGADENAGALDEPDRLLALRPQGAGEEDWLTVFEAGAFGYYATGPSVAASLADRPAVDFGEPALPVTRWRLAGIGLLLALLALMVTPYVKRGRRAWLRRLRGGFDRPSRRGMVR